MGKVFVVMSQDDIHDAKDIANYNTFAFADEDHAKAFVKSREEKGKVASLTVCEVIQPDQKVF